MDSYQKVEELLKEKQQNIKTDEEKEKCNMIKLLLEEDDIFFKLESSTTLGILEFLGVNQEESKEMYFDLISIKNYQEKVPKERISRVK